VATTWKTLRASAQHAVRQGVKADMVSFNMKKFNNASGQAFVIDPVCEMKVDPQSPPFKMTLNGKTYYFCSEACKQVFERMPEKYIKADESRS
jgi:YHS domain-containing protein